MADTFRSERHQRMHRPRRVEIEKSNPSGDSSGAINADPVEIGVARATAASGGPVSVLPEVPVSRRRVLEVVAAVIEHEGMILACRRRPEKAAGGKWEFPGGKLEQEETHSEALVREIQEELGALIEVTAPLRVDDTVVGDLVIRLTCLRARLLGEVPTKSLDHDELRWISPADLTGLDWAAPDLPAVAELASASVT